MPRGKRASQAAIPPVIPPEGAPATLAAAATRKRERVLQHRPHQEVEEGSQQADPHWRNIEGITFNGRPAAETYIGEHELEGEFQLITIHDNLTAKKVVPKPVIEIV